MTQSSFTHQLETQASNELTEMGSCTLIHRAVAQAVLLEKASLLRMFFYEQCTLLLQQLLRDTNFRHLPGMVRSKAWVKG